MSLGAQPFWQGEQAIMSRSASARSAITATFMGLSSFLEEGRGVFRRCAKALAGLALDIDEPFLDFSAVHSGDPPIFSIVLDLLLEPTEATIMSEGSQYWVGGGEREYLLNERRWSRPTLDVNGFLSGFTGEGSKTIIPNTAMAKISMRLVPNQNPSKIFANFKSYVESLAPKHAKLEVIHHADCLPYKAPLSHPVFNLAKKCLSEAFQKPTVYFATGGSIGAIPVLTTALNNIPCLMIAVGNADDNLHAPNEFIRIDNISKCLIAMTYFYSNLRQVKK
jgi:acetylornithine deacetylase/succinyl-diaminopimelate desuccinylase-like protein